jgi:hypothetical protein
MPINDDFISDKNDRLDSVPSEFVKSMSSIEGRVSKEIEALVSQLEMENGEIILSEKNMALIESINQRIKDLIFDSVYEKNLTSFLGEFKKQAELNNTYFMATVPDFEVTPVYQSILKSSQRNALSLLNEDAFTQALILPIKQTLESSITNKVSFADTLTNLRYIIEGDEEIDGRLMAHVKRVAYDSFAISDRSYTNTIATDLGLEFYRYTGGKIEDTRCFCAERAGKFFHREEIKAWGRGEKLGKCKSGDLWEGANSNTDEGTIFFYAGGYNCRHSILPVSKKSVPSEVMQRAKAEGYIN